MDCLDRTNVIESVYAREVLQTVVRSYFTYTYNVMSIAIEAVHVHVCILRIQSSVFRLCRDGVGWGCMSVRLYFFLVYISICFFFLNTPKRTPQSHVILPVLCWLFPSSFRSWEWSHLRTSWVDQRCSLTRSYGETMVTLSAGSMQGQLQWRYVATCRPQHVYRYYKKTYM